MNNEKIKVLLVSPYNAKRVGGIGTWSKSILDYFENSDRFEIVFQNTFNALKGNLHSSRMRRVLVGIEDTALILVKLFFNLLFKNPDIVHYTSSASLALIKDKMALFIVKNVFRKQFVIHWHFGRIPEICISKNSEYEKLMFVVRKANANIVLDEKSLNTLQNEGIKHVFYIPNPMTSAIYDATKDIDIILANANRTNGEVLFVGHVIATKGVFELVKCCVDCLEVKKLVLVGPVLPDVKEQILDLSKRRSSDEWLEFKGELCREEVYFYYRTCSVFCLPSYTEGFPYVILEAMAFGCPIVATDVGAIAEMLQDESGMVISPHDEAALGEALRKVLLDKALRDKMGTNAFARVMSVYTHDVIFKQYESLWQVKKI